MNKSINLLAVGPLPPPPVGGTVSFQLFCGFIESQADLICLSVVDTSPKRLKESRIFSITNLRKAWSIICQFGQQVKSAHQVLIFGSNGFLLSMAPMLVLIAKIAHKPCYIRPFGGSLDRYFDGLGFPKRLILQTMLKHVNGLIVQTNMLYDSFFPLLGSRVHLVPGYRQMPSNVVKPKCAKANNSLRLVYIGNIREEKGIFVLLESLRSLNSTEQDEIQLDFYGVVLDSVATRFKAELAKTKNTKYCGVIDPEKVSSTLTNYDAMIFPTYYQGEGHPGVLIEAMIAGIPVITTRFRSVPELVEENVNGLLVLPQDSGNLTEAIRLIFYDRLLLHSMAEKNWEKRMRYDAEQVVPLILQAMGNGMKYQNSDDHLLNRDVK